MADLTDQLAAMLARLRGPKVGAGELAPNTARGGVRNFQEMYVPPTAVLPAAPQQIPAANVRPKPTAPTPQGEPFTSGTRDPVEEARLLADALGAGQQKQTEWAMDDEMKENDPLYAMGIGQDEPEPGQRLPQGGDLFRQDPQAMPMPPPAMMAAKKRPPQQ